MTIINFTVIARALEGLSLDTYHHCLRVQSLAFLLGKTLGLTEIELTNLSIGSLLHDIGKSQVPAEILQKPAALAQAEWEVMEKHPVYGWEYAAEVDLAREVQEIILNHHFWYNGEGGYPAANGTSMPGPLTQITTVADVLDAMTQDRPYRKALSLDVALGFLQEQSGSQFSPDVVEAVLENLEPIRALLSV